MKTFIALVLLVAGINAGRVRRQGWSAPPSGWSSSPPSGWSSPTVDVNLEADAQMSQVGVAAASQESQLAAGGNDPSTFAVVAQDGEIAQSVVVIPGSGWGSGWGGDAGGPSAVSLNINDQTQGAVAGEAFEGYAYGDNYASIHNAGNSDASNAGTIDTHTSTSNVINTRR